MKKTMQDEAVSQSLYDIDFFEWTQTIAERLRRGELPPADGEHIAEEIQDMGKRDRREAVSRMTVLVKHLMKWAAQPELRDTSTWKATIIEQRHQIQAIVEDSPSLRGHLVENLPNIFGRAEREASAETHLDVRVDQAVRITDDTVTMLLDDDFFPDGLNWLRG